MNFLVLQINVLPVTIGKKINPSSILTKKNISKVYSKNENEKSKEKSTNIALVIKKILTNIKNYII